MTEFLHHPDHCRLGKNDPKPPHIDFEELVDVERVNAENEIPANIVTSLDANGNPIPLAMYLNDSEGDCTIAGAGNTLRVDSDGELEITDEDVQAGYVAVTAEEGAAYDPATGANDNGCAELDVLDYWVKVGIGGNRLLAHAGVKFRNQLARRTALWMCGPLYPGWQLSTDQQTQAIWAPGPAAAGSWGGHCAPIADDYTEIPAGRIIAGVQIPADIEEILVLLTWGSRKPARGSYVDFACDELHVPLTDRWLARNQGNPAINMAALTAYLKTLGRES